MKRIHTIIVGAGPAGLQLGYFLEQRNRDYLIIEAKSTAGAFFASQPRHETLLSINKRFNWFSEEEYNLRHDWNSLLTDDYSHLFQEYSKELYPKASALYRYLMDFAEKFALKIQYDTRIRLIEQAHGGDDRFLLTDHEGRRYGCTCLVMATGVVGPQIPDDIEGIELAEGYEDHDTDVARYENKRVAIIGRGNSAFEVANYLAPHAAIIHIALDNQPVKLAWQTHFVGDLRAINNTVLDMYQLKSLHSSIGISIKKISRREDGVLLADIENEVPHWETPGTIRAQLAYDYIIRCTGWRYVDNDLFAPEVAPETDAKSKYPVLSSCWESTVPGLFFAGAATAARDRRAASGFIHGFRYNTRTLFHLLDERYQGVPFPRDSTSVADLDDLLSLADRILQRVSTTSALYQQNGFLCDVILSSAEGAAWYRELPLGYVLEGDRFRAQPIFFTVTLEYGFHRYSPNGANTIDFINPSDDDNGHCPAYLHAIFRRYDAGVLSEELHLDESLVVRYDQQDYTDSGWHEARSARNMTLNFLNRIFKVTSEIFDERRYDVGVGFIPGIGTGTNGDRFPRCMPEPEVATEGAALSQAEET